MGLTRSKKQNINKSVGEEDVKEDPLQWQIQKDVREGMVKELKKIQGFKETEPILPVLPSQKIVSFPVF